MAALRQCRAIVVAQWRTGLSFRSDVAIQLLRSLLSVAVYYYLWRAVFQARPNVGELDLEFMIAYIVLVQIVGNVTRPPGIARELAQGVQDGGVAIHLLRPYNLQFYFLAQTLGAVAWRGMWVVLPIFLVGLALGLPFAHPAHMGWFLLSLPIALVVSVSIETVIGLAAVWLRQNEGLVQLRNFAQAFLSGALVPLALFPPVLARVAAWAPFRSVVDVPLGLYLGYHGPAVLGMQALWAVGLWIFAAWLLGRARWRLTVLGG